MWGPENDIAHSLRRRRSYRIWASHSSVAIKIAQCRGSLNTLVVTERIMLVIWPLPPPPPPPSSPTPNTHAYFIRNVIRLSRTRLRNQWRSALWLFSWENFFFVHDENRATTLRKHCVRSFFSQVGIYLKILISSGNYRDRDIEIWRDRLLPISSLAPSI